MALNKASVTTRPNTPLDFSAHNATAVAKPKITRITPRISNIRKGLLLFLCVVRRADDLLVVFRRFAVVDRFLRTWSLPFPGLHHSIMPLKTQGIILNQRGYGQT
jgi:hypothetical protein